MTAMSDLPRLVCATANPHKVAEIADILKGLVELLPRPDDLPDVVEDAGTLEGNARLKAEIVVNDALAMARLVDALTGARGGRSDIVVRAILTDGREASVLLGRDFLIDGELADAMAEIAGVVSVSLTNAEPPRLALVS